MFADKTWTQNRLEFISCFCLFSYPWAAGAGFSRSDARHLTVTTFLVGSRARVRAVAVVLVANIGC